MLLEEVLEKRRAHSKEGLDRNAAGGVFLSLPLKEKLLLGFFIPHVCLGGLVC